MVGCKDLVSNSVKKSRSRMCMPEKKRLHRQSMSSQVFLEWCHRSGKRSLPPGASLRKCPMRRWAKMQPWENATRTSNGPSRNMNSFQYSRTPCTSWYSTTVDGSNCLSLFSRDVFPPLSWHVSMNQFFNCAPAAIFSSMSLTMGSPGKYVQSFVPSMYVHSAKSLPKAFLSCVVWNLMTALQECPPHNASTRNFRGAIVRKSFNNIDAGLGGLGGLGGAPPSNSRPQR
mmetsp:Transcript_53147/g.153395  ORF Transcript_53147/g.153395 Transcript_53147/m.153395 type:complete len:229 (+) Transcript_53147:188-874(+)